MPRSWKPRKDAHALTGMTKRWAWPARETHGDDIMLLTAMTFTAHGELPTEVLILQYKLIKSEF